MASTVMGDTEPIVFVMVQREVFVLASSASGTQIS